MNYRINKGVGKSFEFKGLRTTYVFLALGGIIVSILLYFLLGLLLPFEVTLAIIILCVLASVGGAYYLNYHFGENGLSYSRAQWRTYQLIRNNKRVCSLMRDK